MIAGGAGTLEKDVYNQVYGLTGNGYATQTGFTPINHIEIRNGQARIVGRNVKVKMVISRLIHGTGATIDEVMEQYNLSRAEVHAVLAYYYDHKEAIDRFFEAEDRFAREHIPSADTLKARLRGED